MPEDARSITPFGADRPVFIIGEAGSNWRAGDLGGDEQRAHALVDMVAEAGCDAVKFQVFRAETIYAPGAGPSDYLAAMGITADARTLMASLEIPYGLVAELAAHARERGLAFVASAFSVADAEAINPYVAFHKIASCEINHIRLLEYVAATGKPVVISTGAATYDDIRRAVGFLRARTEAPLALLQCAAAYPAPAEALNLRAIPALARDFGVVAGLSDHTVDPVAAPAAAVALGAKIIEKHCTLDKKLPGPDHAFALEPGELAALVRTVRLVEKMLGAGEKTVHPAEEEIARFAVRGIQATRAIAAGELLVEGDNIAILRPGKNRRGLNPFEIQKVHGKRATRAIAAGEGICEGDFA